MLFILLPALCLLVEGQSNLENLQTSFQPVHAWCTPVNQSTIHTVYNKTLLSILLHGMATFQDIYMLQRATTVIFFYRSPLQLLTSVNSRVFGINLRTGFLFKNSKSLQSNPEIVHN